jgi:hypothetical protein
MLAASTEVNKTFWFCLSMILLLCFEIFVGIVVGLSFCCRSQSSGSSYDITTSTVPDEVQLHNNEEERLVQYPAAQTTPMNYSGELG